jgi:hypothetical protein
MTIPLLIRLSDGELAPLWLSGTDTCKAAPVSNVMCARCISASAVHTHSSACLTGWTGSCRTDSYTSRSAQTESTRVEQAPLALLHVAALQLSL